MAFPCCLLVANIPLNDTSQSDRQFREIGDVQKGIAVNAFYGFLVLPNGGGHQVNALAPVLLMDAPQVFLRGGAVVAGCLLYTSPSPRDTR